jgi:hypothetical protein
MTENELSRVLYDLGVPSHLYRLDGTDSELAHVLDCHEDRWEVFLSERGGKSSTREFANERDACAYLFGQVCWDLARSGRLLVTPAPT